MGKVLVIVTVLLLVSISASAQDWAKQRFAIENPHFKGSSPSNLITVPINEFRDGDFRKYTKLIRESHSFGVNRYPTQGSVMI